MEYDAIIVGSGPNGLAAAITLQRAGLSVLMVEGASMLGGGTRTQEVTLPGFYHDICSAIHPMAAASPFFRTLPLEQFGLRYLHPTILAAHPFDEGEAAVLMEGLADTVASLGEDGDSYRRLVEPWVARWNKLSADILGPMRWPDHPFAMMRFGLSALPSAAQIVRRF
ncbi:MAG TPA: NAD(P)-binding protein, partial [Opitutaceae bacterium]|nr:NAD(P)-binding protein [Opitutaceae bacterium]